MKMRVFFNAKFNQWIGIATLIIGLIISSLLTLDFVNNGQCLLTPIVIAVIYAIHLAASIRVFTTKKVSPTREEFVMQSLFSVHRTSHGNCVLPSWFWRQRQ